MQGAVTCVLCLEREPNSEIAVPLLLTGSADASIKVWDPMVVREPGGTKAAPCIQVSAAPPRAPSADSLSFPPWLLPPRSSHAPHTCAEGARSVRALARSVQGMPRRTLTRVRQHRRWWGMAAR